MESTSPPAWVEFILAEMNRRFDATDTKLDKLVTQDTFRDEKTRVDAMFNDMRKDIAENERSIQAEAQSRVSEGLARAKQDKEEVERRQAVAQQTKWQWFAIPFAAVVGWLADYVLGGGLAR